MMTADYPDIKRSSRYPIGEAARLLGVDRKTLRMWHNSGEIECEHDRKGRKLFRGSALLDYWRQNL